MLCPQRPDRWLWDGLIGFYGFLQLTAGKLRSSEKQYTLLITHPWLQLQSLLNDSKKGTQSIEKIDNQRIKKYLTWNYHLLHWEILMTRWKIEQALERTWRAPTLVELPTSASGLKFVYYFIAFYLFLFFLFLKTQRSNLKK